MQVLTMASLSPSPQVNGRGLAQPAWPHFQTLERGDLFAPAKEAEREVRMSSVFQHKEKANLERVFAHERAEASQRIIDITSLHEKVLAQSMIKLGLT